MSGRGRQRSCLWGAGLEGGSELMYAKRLVPVLRQMGNSAAKNVLRYLMVFPEFRSH